jgi:hypothetical protein
LLAHQYPGNRFVNGVEKRVRRLALRLWGVNGGDKMCQMAA